MKKLGFQLALSNSGALTNAHREAVSRRIRCRDNRSDCSMFAGLNEAGHVLIVLIGVDFVEAIAAFLAQQPGLTARRTYLTSA